MKTPIKILILVVFIFLAVGGVLVYMKTRVAPPSPMSLEGKSPELADSIEKVFLATDRINQSLPLRAEALDLLILLNNEKLLSDDMANKRIGNIENHHGKLINQYSDAVFNRSVWPKADLDSINHLASRQLQAKLIGGQSALDASVAAGLRDKLDVLKDFAAASKAASSTSFVNLGDASAKISASKKWLDHPVLSKNEGLMSDLRAVPARISSNHYAYLERQLAGLQNINGISTPDEYDSRRTRPFMSALSEYESTGIYGSKKSTTTGLRSRASAYIDAAIERIYERNRSMYEDEYDF